MEYFLLFFIIMLSLLSIIFCMILVILYIDSNFSKNTNIERELRVLKLRIMLTNFFLKFDRQTNNNHIK